MTKLSWRRQIILCVALGIVWKLLYLLPFSAAELAQEPFIDNDSPSYYEPAVTLAQSFAYHSYTRTPGYPALLALIYRLTGSAEPLAATNLYVTFLLQALLLSLGCIPLMLAVRRLTASEHLPFFVGLLWAIHNAAMYFSSRLLTDGLAAFVMCCLVYAVVVAEQSQQPRWYMIEGGLLVFLILLRPSFSLMPIALGLAQLLNWWRRSTPTKNYALAAVIGLAVLLIPSLTPTAWALRNQMTEGDSYYSRLSTFGVWAYTVESAFDAAANRAPRLVAYQHEFKTLLPTMKAAEMDALYRQRTRQRIFSAPLTVARYFVVNAVRLLLPHSPAEGYKAARTRDFWKKRSWKARASYLYFLANTVVELLTTLACLGYLGLSLYRYADLYAALPQAFLSVSLALIAYWWLIHSNANAGSRFLLPLQPLLLVSCANALGVMTAPRPSRAVAES